MPRQAPDLDELRARIVGQGLGGAPARIEAHEAWIGHEAMGSDPHRASLQPSWAIVIALRGMGMTLDELFAVADAHRDDGVMFGGLRLHLDTELGAEVTYDVTGRIDDVERRVGRRAGTFDLLRFTLDLAAAGSRCASVECTFVLPRAA